MRNLKKYIQTALLTLPIFAYAATPQAPSNLILKALSATTVSISWKDNSSDESGFKIFRDGKLIHKAAPNIINYIDTGLSALTTYNYIVKATNDDTADGTVVHNSLQKSILNGNDDVEERSDGSMYINSSDLELTDDNNGQQTIGLRFQALSIPKNATITKAYIQFTTDEVSSEATNLTIHAEATDNALAFLEIAHNVSSRTLSSASVAWSPSAWNSAGEHSQAQATPNLSTVVQEIVNRTGWKSGNTMAFIISGSGRRTAESFNGDSTNAPKLHIEYSFSTEAVADTTPPVITLKGANPQNLTVGDTYTNLGATAIDNIDGDISSFITVTPTNIDTSSASNHTITYTITDTAGNNAYVTRSVVVSQTPPPTANGTGIVINEVLAANARINLDPDFYKFSDWIELYNHESHSIDIGGFYLSDDTAKPTKYKIPSGTTIASHGYLLIWADEKNTKSKAIHANFKLSQKGETLTLSDKSGNVVDIIKYKKLEADVSISKTNSDIVYMEPTPNKANTQTYSKLEFSKKPSFSGDNEQKITLTSENNGVIYYTLDGSKPTKNSNLYNEPININKTTVVKAISAEGGKLISKVTNKTYFINHQTTLPIVSLIVDPKYLFDNKIGIYTDGTNGVVLSGCGADNQLYNFAREWKRPSYLIYYDNNHQEQFGAGLDIRISGQCSRLSNKKSFKLDLDKKYGAKSIKYKLFDGKNIDKYKDFKIRTGYRKFEFGDILAAMIVENESLDVDYQAYKAVQMFVNGEYWGIYNLREQKGKNYLKSNYPEIDSKLDIVKGGYEAKQGDLTAYNELGRYVSNHDLSIDTNYQEIKTMIDEDNFIDYMALLIYSGNDDWLGSNYRPWKEKKAGAKWRWMLDDIDRGFHSSVKDQNLFNDIKNRSHTMATLFKKLSLNSTFKTKFKNRFNDLLNTAFSPSTVKTIVANMKDERIDYMDLESKWGISKSTFNNYIEDLNFFIEKRRDIVRSQLNNF